MNSGRTSVVSFQHLHLVLEGRGCGKLWILALAPALVLAQSLAQALALTLALALALALAVTADSLMNEEI